eukprot:CAMPEP_0197880162 /NCGR_PEP_ID=MMETSP1439-20131203/8050_1 /TAXON_ID=66791 /ORGANISM="Gonyaulax spinifera, Strain CCMP409" /LENGTH=77 /DNA_ID=CAMNT_0043499707 /DNA_START=1 /DNA_END=231 /DNA_ORIENTATION=+
MARSRQSSAGCLMRNLMGKLHLPANSALCDRRVFAAKAPPKAARGPQIPGWRAKPARSGSRARPPAVPTHAPTHLRN